jgi:hypothetical protein
MKLLILLFAIVSFAKCEVINTKTDIDYRDFRSIIKEKIASGSLSVKYSFSSNSDFVYTYNLPLLDLNKKHPWHSYVNEKVQVKGFFVFTVACKDDKFYIDNEEITQNNFKNKISSKENICIVFNCDINSKPFKNIKLFHLLYEHCASRYLFAEELNK